MAMFSDPVGTGTDHVSGDGKVRCGVVQGQRYETSFLTEGLHRRWNWCGREHEEDEGAEPDTIYYDCAFIIQPNGMGFYFDFKDAEVGEDQDSSGTFRCRKLRAY